MASVHEQRLQFAQRRHAHNRLVGLVHVAAGPGVEHPHWDLDRMGVEIRRQTTANDTLILERPRAMDPNGATEPRMPAVAHLQRLGTMGVPLLACMDSVKQHGRSCCLTGRCYPRLIVAVRMFCDEGWRCVAAPAFIASAAPSILVTSSLARFDRQAFTRRCRVRNWALEYIAGAIATRR